MAVIATGQGTRSSEVLQPQISQQLQQENRSEKDIGRLFRERKPIDEALNAAAREAVKRHRQQGQPLVVCRNGQPVLISPEEVDDEAAEE